MCVSCLPSSSNILLYKQILTLLNDEFSVYVILRKIHFNFSLTLTVYVKILTGSTLIDICCEYVKETVKAVISNNVIRQRAKNIFCDDTIILRYRNSREVIKSFICPTNAHLNCFKMLKFTLKITINSPTYFGLTKPPSGSLRCVLR
jgi:hypothetical protein